LNILKQGINTAVESQTSKFRLILFKASIVLLVAKVEWFMIGPLQRTNDCIQTSIYIPVNMPKISAFYKKKGLNPLQGIVWQQSGHN